MGGLNSLSGLGSVNVDFRPTIELNAQNTGNTTQALMPEAEANAAVAPQPEQAEAKSVVRELDVLLVNAAGKSVSADVLKVVQKKGGKLVELGVMSDAERSNLEKLAKDAMSKLKALDKFTGKELANALMFDEKEQDLVWKKGLFGMSSSAKAVKAAIDAQQALSEAVESFSQKMAANKEVDAELQNAFTEVQFQCDRRVSEIDSIVLRMYDLVQKDVVDKKTTDPKITAMLNATFKELMPREAIMSHGTSEALELINKTFGEKMRPLAQKLDDFKADSSRVLGKDEIAALQRDMMAMSNALMNVRKNGLNKSEMVSGTGDRIVGNDGEVITKMTEVDSTLLNEMEKLLGKVAAQIADAKGLSVTRSRQVFLHGVKANLFPENTPGGEAVIGSNGWLSNPVLDEFRTLRMELVKTLSVFAQGKKPMDQFDATINKCIAKFNKESFSNLKEMLKAVGFDESVAKNTAKTVHGLYIVKAQFKELMESSKRLLDSDDAGIATSDVRRLMLGEVGLSTVIEARSRGFKQGDVDPATEEQNIVDSRLLGAGAGGQTYLLTTKDGGEVVFKPEFDSRIGLEDLALGAGGAYVDTQQTANLNLATQDTAKVFGCDDVIVKYSVGNHDGQFGVFMEKAKGCSGGAFAAKSNSGGGGIAPADLHKITDAEERAKIQGSIAKKLNRLMWLDMITGQGDRHHGNYFVHIDDKTHEVTVKGIDNDASFNSWQVGLRKYSLNKGMAALFEAELKSTCSKLHGWGGKAEYGRALSDPAIVKDSSSGSMTVDLSKAKSPEIKMAIISVLGLQSIALPEEIDKGFYDKLMELDQNPDKMQGYLNSLKPRVSADALKAVELRLKEAIEHAKKLANEKKVYGEDEWKNPTNLSKMTEIPTKVEIKKSDGNTVSANLKLKCVKDFIVRDCPSFYKREFFQDMFNKTA
jgi:hypothetical protein